MRTSLIAFALAVALSACTPDIVSGAYVCGPEQACPEGQVCNGADDNDADLTAETCVLPGLAKPFACTPSLATEPDDTMGQGFTIQNLGCVSARFEIMEGCMLADDSADWLTFVVPSTCTAVMVQARLSFPYAYEELGLELWDFDANTKLASDAECKQGVESSSLRRCLDQVLTPGKKYGVLVKPTGAGTCSGSCTYNRYYVSVQLATPG